MKLYYEIILLTTMMMVMKMMMTTMMMTTMMMITLMMKPMYEPRCIIGHVTCFHWQSILLNENEVDCGRGGILRRCGCGNGGRSGKKPGYCRLQRSKLERRASPWHRRSGDKWEEQRMETDGRNRPCSVNKHGAKELNKQRTTT